MFHTLFQSGAIFQTADVDDSGVWISNGEESTEKYYEVRNPMACNMHVRMKIQPINVMLLAESVLHIFNCARELKIILQSHKRTEFQPIPLVAIQSGIQEPVIAHSYLCFFG